MLRMPQSRLMTICRSEDATNSTNPASPTAACQPAHTIADGQPGGAASRHSRRGARQKHMPLYRRRPPGQTVQRVGGSGDRSRRIPRRAGCPSAPPQTPGRLAAHHPPEQSCHRLTGWVFFLWVSGRSLELRCGAIDPSFQTRQNGSKQTVSLGRHRSELTEHPQTAVRRPGLSQPQSHTPTPGRTEGHRRSHGTRREGGGGRAGGGPCGARPRRHIAPPLRNLSGNFPTTGSLIAVEQQTYDGAEPRP